MLAIPQNECENGLLASSCLYICQFGTTRLWRHGFNSYPANVEYMV